MSIRVHELHPALVHFPLVLAPVAFIADLFGRISGNRDMMKLGERLMPIAAASGAVSAASGLVAQGAVKPGRAHDLLITHRNINAGLVGLLAVLALERRGKSQPGTGYLLASAAGLIGMAFTAYIGGEMVYHHGVGVQPAGGVRDEHDPELHYGELGQAARTAVGNAREAAVEAVHHLREGKIAPALRPH
jgi:uncharacterized membrane protein